MSDSESIMDKSGNYVPRLNVAIREDQANDLRELLPWGVRRLVFENIVDLLISALKVDKTGAIGGLIHNQFTLAVTSNVNTSKHSTKHTRPAVDRAGADTPSDQRESTPIEGTED